MTLAPRQAECLAFIRQYISEHGRSPYKREIAAAMGISSTGAVRWMIIALEQRGFIRQNKYFVRGLELISTPTAGETP